MADSGHFDGFRAPLSSAPFCICLVIRHFSKATEDRSPADTAISPPMRPSSRPHRESEPLSHEFRALFPGESAYPAHSSDSVVGRRSKRPGPPTAARRAPSLLCRGRQVFSGALLLDLSSAQASQHPETQYTNQNSERIGVGEVSENRLNPLPLSRVSDK